MSIENQLKQYEEMRMLVRMIRNELSPKHKEVLVKRLKIDAQEYEATYGVKFNYYQFMRGGE